MWRRDERYVLLSDNWIYVRFVRSLNSFVCRLLFDFKRYLTTVLSLPDPKIYSGILSGLAIGGDLSFLTFESNKRCLKYANAARTAFSAPGYPPRGRQNLLLPLYLPTECPGYNEMGDWQRFNESFID